MVSQPLAYPMAMTPLQWQWTTQAVAGGRQWLRLTGQHAALSHSYPGWQYSDALAFAQVPPTTLQLWTVMAMLTLWPAAQQRKRKISVSKQNVTALKQASYYNYCWVRHFFYLGMISWFHDFMHTFRSHGQIPNAKIKEPENHKHIWI